MRVVKLTEPESPEAAAGIEGAFDIVSLGQTPQPEPRARPLLGNSTAKGEKNEPARDEGHGHDQRGGGTQQ